MKIAIHVVVTALIALVLSGSPAFAQAQTMSAEEQANLKVVSDWWREVLQAGHTELAEKYMAEDYLQHNPNISTGRAAFVQVFSRRAPRDIQPALNPAPVIQFAKGPYVVFVWEREAKDQSGATYKYSFFDIMRVQNGRVAEHWDSVFKNAPPAGQPAPAPVVPGIGPRPAKPRNTPAEQAVEDIANLEFKDILQYGHLELADKVMAPGYIQHNPNVPTVLHNAMIAPLVRFPITGAIWYQGESNASRAEQYKTLFPAMITDWRNKWDQGDFPFFFVQLANFMDAKPEPEEDAWAELREAQRLTLSLPKTGMACIIDIGEAKDIHPRNKQDVGKRLALAARVLRQVLIDHHRQKDALKRGGGLLRVDLDPERPAAESTMVEFGSMQAALESLRVLHERQAQVLELRIFGGLTVEQVAQALGVSRRTVEADWTVARAFLRRELSRGARV